MTTLHERLLSEASFWSDWPKDGGDIYVRPDGAADMAALLREAAQSLQAAPEGGDTMRGVCESADFEADTLTFRMVGAYYAAAGEYVITPTHPAAAHKEPTK